MFISGAFFIRPASKPDENGEVTYVIGGSFRSRDPVPDGHFCRMVGSNHETSLEMHVDLRDTKDMKEETKGMRIDQILTSF